jgi:hypothetical protein
MKRRKFIGIAAVGAAGVVVPSTVRSADAAGAVLARPGLVSILDDDVLVRTLGGLYREMVPNETTVDALERAILETVDDVRVDLSASDLRRRIDAEVQRDFDSGRTVTLNGWILSLTEARQCALFSLQA